MPPFDSFIGVKQDNDIFHLFVYGTLKKAFDNPGSRLLQKHAQQVAIGKINANLYQVTEYYPGCVISHDASAWIEGEIYQLNQVQELLNGLDEYEGFDTTGRTASEFIRVTVPAYLPDQSCLTCWVYVYNFPVTDLGRLMAFP